LDTADGMTLGSDYAIGRLTKRRSMMPPRLQSLAASRVPVELAPRRKPKPGNAAGTGIWSCPSLAQRLSPVPPKGRFPAETERRHQHVCRVRKVDTGFLLRDGCTFASCRKRGNLSTFLHLISGSVLPCSPKKCCRMALSTTATSQPSS